MQALILVGGEGTRLRPLTSTVPKPVVTLVDRPFMAYMLEWLRSHGVTKVVMACGFLPDQLEQVLGDGRDLGVEITYLVEPEPRGTGGALKFAEAHLEDRFLMLNGDVLTDVDLGAQLRQHEATGATGTLGLVPVEDPSAYGLVLLEEDYAVRGFLEKPGPEQLVGVGEYLISAGIYVLERSVLDLIPPDRNVSIEREVWPALVERGLYGYPARGAYWVDIGTPERYLSSTIDILAGAVRTNVLPIVEDGAEVEGRVLEPSLVASGARVEEGASVGPHAVIGRGAVVERGATVERAVVLDGARVRADAVVREAVLAPGVDLGEGSEVHDHAVLGQDVRVGRGNVLSRGARVFPGVELPDGAIRFP